MYVKMLELAVANGLPVHHKDDLLLHDKRELEENPGKPFVWLLYEMGTHMFLLDKSDSQGRASLVKYIDHNFGHGQRDWVPASKWFYCTGCTCAAQTEVCACGGGTIGAQLRDEVIERVKAFDRRNYTSPSGSKPYANWRQA